MAQDRWYKQEETDKTWWLDNGSEVKGEMIFSFDKKKKYNIFLDYPQNMTQKEVRVFNKENPFWVEFFSE